jgi:acetate kinase
MMSEARLASLSGMGFDMRDLQEAADKGNMRARLAIDTYVYQVRKYLGSFLMMLGHTDVITMTAGTGESSPSVRKRILEGLEEFGIVLDDARNNACIKTEGCISHDNSRIAVWVIPANEELVVVRECSKLLCRLRK